MIFVAHVEDAKSNVQFVCSDEKKNVFLIGDSIRIGYCGVTRAELSDEAEVFYVSDNNRNTQFVITNIYKWVSMFSDPAKVDLIQFNCGHWDVAHWFGHDISLTSESEYARNLQIIIDLLRKSFPNAKIVFATTTTMNPEGEIGVNPRTNEEIECYNSIAVEVATRNDIPINDLYPITREWDGSYYSDPYCHFNTEANKKLGKIVADALRPYLK